MGAMGTRPADRPFFLPRSKDKPTLTTSASLSPALRREMKKRLEDRGMQMASYYAPLDADTAGYRKVFDFAKEMGVETLVAEPPAEVFETLDGLCREYEISLAVA